MAGHSNSVKESIALREPRLVTGSSQSGLCAIPEILDISHPPIPPPRNSGANFNVKPSFSNIAND
jgi:hypothetical protein